MAANTPPTLKGLGRGNKTKRLMKFAGSIDTTTSLFQQKQKYNILESAPHALSRKQFYYAFDVQDGFSTDVLPGFFC